MYNVLAVTTAAFSKSNEDVKSQWLSRYAVFLQFEYCIIRCSLEDVILGSFFSSKAYHCCVHEIISRL